jgi:agmatine deiminase
MGNASDISRAKGGGWLMPEEGALHERTWMAFGADASIWGRRLLPEVRRNIALLARTIAKYEPVSMLVREQELDLARDLVGDGVELVVAPLDDIWIRDTGPVFVRDQDGKKAAVDFNFNGWGNKQVHGDDARVARLIASQAGVDIIDAGLVMEGGSIEVDGEGTAIFTESPIINDNRNPGLTKSACEDILMPLLGLKKIIWLPGIQGMDITDGHVDFYARFRRAGAVLACSDPDPRSFDHDVTKRHLEILASATDARGESLEVTSIEVPATVRSSYKTMDFAAGYLGFYVVNNAVIMQGYGDAGADSAARAAIQKSYPERTIEVLNLDGIAAGGGTIHCVTQQEPAI